MILKDKVSFPLSLRYPHVASLIMPMLMTEIEGLKRKLTSKIGAGSPALVPDWQVSFSPLSQLCVKKFTDICGQVI